jgi:hypothetical protein
MPRCVVRVDARGLMRDALVIQRAQEFTHAHTGIDGYSLLIWVLHGFPWVIGALT